MRLFTPLSADDAPLAISGEGLPDADLWWVDQPQPQEADPDAVWVAIDVPEQAVTEYEHQVPRELGYREFVLPSSLIDRHPVTSAPSADLD